jgi:prophage antirepressor-like protein
MNTMIPFTYDSKEIRVIQDEKGNPWWVCKDICEILDYSEAASAVRILEDDEKGLHKVQTLQGEQDMLIISESGLYTLILRSNKPEAKPFRKWVTSEVLPTIRKTGSYSMPGCMKPDKSRHMLDVAREVERASRVLGATISVAKRLGLKGSRAVSKANEATFLATGFDCVKYIGINIETSGGRSELDAFINEKLNIDPEKSVSPPLLFAAFKKWRIEMELEPLGKFEFYEKITTELNIKRRRPTGSTVEVFEGIELKGE